MEEVNKYGMMDQSMKDIGLIIKLTEKEDLSMLMEMCTMVNGKMIKLTDMELIFIWMELNMRDSGKKINNMDLGKYFNRNFKN